MKTITMKTITSYYKCFDDVLSYINTIDYIPSNIVITYTNSQFIVVITIIL